MNTFPPMDLANFIHFVAGVAAGVTLAGIAFVIAMKA